MLVGERIRKLRIQRNFSINELSSKADVSKSYLSYIERGIQENPSLQVLSRLAKTLEVSLDEITGPSIHPISDSKQPVDPEWLEMIDEAIRNGVSKEEFSLYIDFLKYRKNNVE